MISRTYAIAKKEIKQLIRDWRMLFVLLFFPTFLLGVFGYAVNFDVQNVKLAVYDQEMSEKSRDFINSLSSSQYFDVVKTIRGNEEIKSTLDKKQAQVVLIIPRSFSRDAGKKSEPAEMQVLVDGVDGNTATIIQNYLTAAAMKFSGKIQSRDMSKYGMSAGIPVELETVFWFNPELETTLFLIPGLIAMILIVTAVVSVSLSLVREKERGTIEQINVSSLRIYELLIGKTLPYWLIAVVDALFILFASYFLFGTEVRGNYFLLFLSITFFLLACTSMGIFVSVISDSMQVAFAVSTFVSMLPSIIISGFIFPIESMPGILQLLSNITPAKFFIISLRAVMLRGVGISAFWDQFIYMFIFALIMFLMAVVVNQVKEKKV